MSTVLRDLYEDHRNINNLLDLLAHELDAVEDESSNINFDLMRDIMTYMLRYPDYAHHPKEDLMFERMRARGCAPATEDTIAKLLREHGALAKKGEAFYRALCRVVDGAMVERPELLATGRNYVEFLRYHVRLEEDTVFPETETLLGDADWSEIAQAFEAQADPVFGPAPRTLARSLDVDLEFRSLHQHIKNSTYLATHRRD